jgi:hypothetical protein
MATNRDLLKEAIADAKAVKEMAIANAKAALEEAFTPQLKTMLSAKLQEMELEEEKEVEEAEIDEVGFEDMNTLNTGVTEEKADEDNLEEIDLEELLAELEEDEEKMVNESELTEEDQEEEYVGDDERYEYEKGKEAGEKEEGEALDLEDMTDEDLKKFIEDVIADMVESGELEAGEGAEEEEGEDMETVDVDVELDEEVDLAELLREIEEMENSLDENEDDITDKIKDLSPEEEKEIASDLKSALKEIKVELSEGKLHEFLKEFALNENMSTEEAKALADSSELKQEIAKLKKNKKIAKIASMLGLSITAVALVLAVMTFGGAAAAAGTVAAHVGVPIGAKAAAALFGFFGGLGPWILGMNKEHEIGKSIKKKERELSKVKEELYESYDTIKILKKELNEINLLNAKLLYTNKIFRSKNLTESQKVKVLGSFDNATTVKETKLVFETLNEGIKVRKPSVEKTLGRASKATNTPTTKKPIVESNEAYLRMQKLAGLIK